MKKWKFLRSEPGEDLYVAKVRFDWFENPRNGVELKATVLETPDWVNTVALTPEGDLLVVKQFRLGMQTITTEVPAGVVEQGEEPLEAAKRELIEETGYTTDDWEYMGWVEANPAYQNNRCHQFVARNVRQTAERNQDLGEDVSFEIMTLDEVKEEIKAERMRNTFALLTLSKVFDIWDVG